jgi:hypothetical protein
MVLQLEKNSGIPTWEKFVEGVNKKLGPPVHSNPLGEFSHLRHTRTVEETRINFGNS